MPGMRGLDVNNVVAGASGEQLPSYERSSGAHGHRHGDAGRPPEKGYVSQQQ